MPEGVCLPSVPSPQVPPSLPTTPLALHDIKVKEESDDRRPAPRHLFRERIPPPSVDEKRKTDEVLGQLDAGLRHLIQTYDSDATESSSGKINKYFYLKSVTLPGKGASHQFGLKKLV
jgi:hypothetical protein